MCSLPRNCLATFLLALNSVLAGCLDEMIKCAGSNARPRRCADAVLRRLMGMSLASASLRIVYHQSHAVAGALDSLDQARSDTENYRNRFSMQGGSANLSVDEHKTRAKESFQRLQVRNHLCVVLCVPVNISHYRKTRALSNLSASILPECFDVFFCLFSRLCNCGC